MNINREPRQKSLVDTTPHLNDSPPVRVPLQFSHQAPKYIFTASTFVYVGIKTLHKNKENKPNRIDGGGALAP